MRKSSEHCAADPRHRACMVFSVLRGSANSSTLDAWGRKLYSIYNVRSKFKDKYEQSWHSEFSQSFPLYCKLLDTYEDDSIGGDRQIIEAALLSSVDCMDICRELRVESYDPLFLAMYRELFFDVLPILGNPVTEFKYIVSPIISYKDSDKLAVGDIWKLLALVGGLPTLKRKGFGTEALKAEDIMYILQLVSFRNCSALLKYANVGSEFFKDNPAAAGMLATIADLESVRGPGRRLDFIAEVSSVAKNNLSTLLSEGIKLISAPSAEVLRLTELDGSFNIGKDMQIERTNHINFLENSESRDDA